MAELSEACELRSAFRFGPRGRTSCGRAMIEPLAPAAACAEMFSDAPESTMFPIESPRSSRLWQSAAVSSARSGTARKAMQQIGVPAVPVLPDVDGAPCWPVGLVGSMTHCAGYRAAAVARSDELFGVGVGIDAEPHAALPDAVLDLVLRDEERARLPAVAVIPGVDRAPRWPVGVVGSMTHCAGYRAAAVARSD